MSDCKHEWDYESSSMLCNPPKKRRKCKKCGLLELITVGEYQENIHFKEC